VPCPLCGGLIHPIAGKCKHCKADLTTYHAARPAANAPLPALLRGQLANDAPRPINGHRAAVHAPIAHAVAITHDVSHPVLPPRPTSRSQTSGTTSSWRSWPIIVIVLATLAIVAAVVLMVWPNSRPQRDGKRSKQPPPAPERMDTQNPGQGAPPKNPRMPTTPPPATPSQGGAPDPWRNTQPAAPPDPAADPNDADDQDHDIDSLADPYSTPHGTPARGRRRLPVNGRGLVMFAMAEHLCRKMVQCGDNDSTTAKVCDSVSTNAADLPTNCPAADRCLQRIDAMACSAQGDDLSQLNKLLTQFPDCEAAVRC
jgi:hypothetical protein